MTSGWSHSYIADILNEFTTVRDFKGDKESRLLFKKRMFRYETKQFSGYSSIVKILVCITKSHNFLSTLKPTTGMCGSRETDETIHEPQFLNLSYVQAQHDFLLGNYPVVREDASQMCALQILAEYGPEFWEDEYKFSKAIERYMSKKVW